MVTHLGTYLGTSLGTAIGRFDPSTPIFDLTKAYSLSGQDASNYLSTQNPGGEAGVATGFGGFFAIRLPVLSALSRYTFNRANTAGSNGWLPWIDSSNRLQVLMGSGAASAIGSPQYQISASDVGKILSAFFYHDGSFVRLFVNRVQVGSGTAITGYTANASRTVTGGSPASAGTAPAIGVEELFWLTFRGTPSQAQIEALFDLARARQDAPTPTEWPNGITHRWSLRETLAAANQPVADRTAAPASIVDTVTGAVADRLDRTGSAMVIRQLDATARTSYGAMGFSATSHLESAAGAGIKGIAGGLTVVCVTTFTSTTGSEFVACCADATTANGWAFYRFNGTLNFYAGNGTAAVGPNRTIAAADLNTPALLHLVCNGSTVEGFYNGVSVGTAACVYSPPGGAIKCAIGDRPASTAPSLTQVTYRLEGADVAYTAAEIATQYATWQRTGQLPAPTGKPFTHDYNLTLDLAGGSVPATVVDRVGTDNLTRVGTDLIVSARTDRLWNNENAPIFYGADALTSADYFESSYDDPTVAGSSFYNAFLVYAPVVTQAANVLAGASSAVTTNAGWDFRLAANNASASWSMGDGTAFTASASATLTTGKINLVVCVWDQTNLKQRIYVNRAEVGAGTARTAYARVGAGTKISLGRSPRDLASATGARTLLGFSQGVGLPTLQQVQALYDAVLATERMQGIAGLVSTVVDLTQDVAGGGSIPASLANRAGAGTFAKNGAPTLTSLYHRAFPW